MVTRTAQPWDTGRFGFRLLAAALLLIVLAGCNIEIGPDPGDETPTVPPSPAPATALTGQAVTGTPAATVLAVNTPTDRGAQWLAEQRKKPALIGLFMLSSSEGWAVGRQSNGDGAILHYTGDQWAEVPAPAKATLRDVFMLSPTDGWIAGEHTIDQYTSTPLLLHWDGTQWQEVPAPADVTPYRVRMTSASAGWIGGIFGLLRYSGGQWTVVPNPAEANVRVQALTMLSADEGWAVGAADDNGNDIALHYHGGKWEAGRLPARIAATSVQMISPAEGWAVGLYGIAHYQDGTWTKVTRPRAVPLRDVFMISPTEGWAVGSGSTYPESGALMLHYTGGAWEVVDNVEGTDLSAIQMVSPTEGWVVGGWGTILHYQNKSWVDITNPTPTP